MEPKDIENLIAEEDFRHQLRADNDVRDALSKIVKIVSSMLTTGMSIEISEWDLPKTTPLKTKRKIVKEAHKWNDVNKRRSMELKKAYDVLSRHFRTNSKL